MASSNDSTTISIITSTTATTTAATMGSTGGMSGWAIMGIVVAILVLIAFLGVAAFFLYKRILKQKACHGEYRPQLEETIHEKNTPYISPPNIEGLI